MNRSQRVNVAHAVVFERFPVIGIILRTAECAVLLWNTEQLDQTLAVTELRFILGNIKDRPKKFQRPR